MENKKYVLITSARNEEEFIEKTIRSVINQTVLPMKWVIVSDGSTDRTDEIVRKYTEDFPWIILHRRDSGGKRGFDSKANALREATFLLKNIDYDFIGNLDVDLSFENDYFENIIRFCDVNQRIGIAGGTIYDEFDIGLKDKITNEISVAGAVQMFRRNCFIDVGGYQPISTGGIDTIAEVTARMNGWETKTFKELKVYHHRRTGTYQDSVYRARFKQGFKDYFLGYDPLFFIFREIYRISEPPYILGSILRISGFVKGLISGKEYEIPEHILKFIRNEQRNRIFKFNLRGL